MRRLILALRGSCGKLRAAAFSAREHTMDNWVHLGRGVLGLGAFIALAAAFSTNRRRIPWRVVGIGVAMQLLIGWLVLHVAPVRVLFEAVGTFFVRLLGFTNEGTALVFGWINSLAGGNIPEYPFTAGGPIFVISVLPTIIFFAAFTSLLYRLGLLQLVVFAFAWVMSKTLKLSGAETLSASANIFVGQTEAPLLIKPYLAQMTRSELLAIMIGGMATIAGGVMAVYITLLRGAGALGDASVDGVRPFLAGSARRREDPPAAGGSRGRVVKDQRGAAGSQPARRHLPGHNRWHPARGQRRWHADRVHRPGRAGELDDGDVDRELDGTQ
jgi:hypothetical protein